MNRESLIAAGFTEEQVGTILKLYKTAIDGNYIPKATFEAERETVKSLKNQITERDNQISTLGKFKGTAEELQNKVSELEKQNKEAKEKFDADLLKAQKDAAIRFDIANAVIDPDDVIPKLDDSKIVFKDGKIVSGLTEQLDSLKESKPHYFKQAESKEGGQPKGWIFGGTPPEGSDGGKGGENKSDAQKFGEMLAASKMSGSAAADKVAETYFK